jgi:hypothetical protein
MGWTTHYTNRPSVDVVREEMIGDGSKYQVVANRGAKYWVLEELETGERFAVVALVRKTRDSITTKIMTEYAGPNDSNFPVKFLDLLSDTDKEYALEWRERVREHHAKKDAQPTVTPGDIVSFDEPIKFTGGFESRRMQFVERNRFRVLDLGNGQYTPMVRLPRAWKTTYAWSLESRTALVYNPIQLSQPERKQQ